MKTVEEVKDYINACSLGPCLEYISKGHSHSKIYLYKTTENLVEWYNDKGQPLLGGRGLGFTIKDQISIWLRDAYLIPLQGLKEVSEDLLWD